MNQQERYELLTKLSEFYVKEVKQNLDCFNKAKFISNISITMFWLLFLSIIGVFIFAPVMNFVSKIFKFPEGLVAILIFFPFIFAVISMGVMKILKRMDKENDIQVFKVSGNSTTLPQSADNEIKKRLMSKFVTLFGDFTWTPFYSSSKFNQKKFSVEGLNILKNPLK